MDLKNFLSIEKISHPDLFQGVKNTTIDCPSDDPYLERARLYLLEAKSAKLLSIDELSTAVEPPISAKKLYETFYSELWKNWFKQFGLEPPPRQTRILEDHPNSLTELQLQALQALTNPTTNKSQETLLKELGLTSTQHYQWMNHPIYSSTYNRWLKNNIKSAEGEVYRKITAQAAKGDSRAQRTFIELSNSQGAGQDIIAVVLEVLQQLLEPEQLYRVATELRLRRAAGELGR